MPRAQVLLLALLAVHVLLGVLCLAASRGERGAPALRWWGWGGIVYSAGLAFVVVKPFAAPLSTFAGNALVAASSLLTIQGALHYTERRLPWPWALAGLAFTVAVLAAGNLLLANALAINFVMPTVIASVAFAYGAAMLLRRPVADARRPARYLAAVLGTAVVMWWLRIAALAPALAEPVDRERLDGVMAAFAIAQILVGVGAVFGLLWIEVHRMQAAMARMAFTDPLTELANRRAIVARFGEEAARARRTGTPFSMLVFDIDHFKDVNDRHGHLAGDALLCHVARLLGMGKRVEDVLGRLGGEEFVVLMGGTVPGGAHAAAERLRESVAATPLATSHHALRVTVSGGLATFPEDGDDWDRLFAAADARLYEAKRAGRNRVVGGPPPA